MQWPVWKKIAAVLVGIVVLGIIFLFVGLPVLAKRQAENIAAFLETLPGDVTAERITATFLENRVTINNLQGTLKYNDDILQLHIAEITLSDPSLGFLFNSKSDSTMLVPAGEVTGLTLTIKNENLDTPWLEERMSRLAFQGLHADLNALKQAGKRASAFLKVLSSLQMTSLSILEHHCRLMLSNSLFPVDFSLDAYTGKNVSLFSLGPSSITNLKIAIPEVAVLSIASSTLKQIRISDIFVPLVSDDQGGEDADTVLDKIRDLWANPFNAVWNVEVTGQVLEKIQLDLVSFPPITCERQSVDFFTDRKVTRIKEGIEDLRLPSQIYSFFNNDLDLGTLSLDVAFDVKIEQKTAVGGDILVRQLVLTEKDLGSVSMESELGFVGDLVAEESEGDRDLFIKKVRLVLEDEKFIERLLLGRGVPPENLAEARKSAAEETLDTVKDFEDESAKVFFKGLSDLLLLPGKLEVSLNPDTPVRMTDILFDTLETPLNAAVTYSPAP